METITATTYPQIETSHLRSSQYSNPAATRQVQPADSHHPSLSAPASQDSLASYQSAASSSNTPRLQTSSSNVSQLTSYSDLTSPTIPSARDQVYEQQRQYAATKTASARVQTPEGSDADGTTPEDSAITSPMSVMSPISTNGTKRTASGHVKNAPSLPNTPLASTFAGARPRGDSISSTSSRASELAMNLKTRLGYAMAKVQNGWEHRNIHEVEHLAAQKVYSPYAHSHRHSMSHLDYSRRPVSAGLTNGASRASMYEDGYSYNQPAYTQSQPTADTSYSSYQYPSKRHSAAFYSSSSQPALATTNTPRLQPAADIYPGPSQSHAHYDYSQPTYAPSAMSPPRTPVNGHSSAYSHAHPRRPTTLRTDTQTAEAERDALQALFQLGSPHRSQMGGQFPHDSQASSGQGSPLKETFAGGMGTGGTGRRVTFERAESGTSAGAASDGGDATV